MGDSNSRITYNMLVSEDGGTSWHHQGTQTATSRESALSRFFPKAERTVGFQYSAVASSHWQPVEWAVREQAYTRKVTGLQPVEQTSLLDDDTVVDSQAEELASPLQDEVAALDDPPIEAAQEVTPA